MRPWQARASALVSDAIDDRRRELAFALEIPSMTTMASTSVFPAAPSCRKMPVKLGESSPEKLQMCNNNQLRVRQRCGEAEKRMQQDKLAQKQEPHARSIYAGYLLVLYAGREGFTLACFRGANSKLLPTILCSTAYHTHATRMLVLPPLHRDKSRNHLRPQSYHPGSFVGSRFDSVFSEGRAKTETLEQRSATAAAKKPKACRCSAERAKTR